MIHCFGALLEGVSEAIKFSDICHYIWNFARKQFEEQKFSAGVEV